MMSPDILEELMVVGSAFVNGAFVTVVYDGLRVFRRIISHGNFFVGVEDLVFWIWTAFWMFSVLYRGNDGELRFYTLLAMALGMIVYHRTISEPLVEFLGKIGRKIVKLLCYPLKMVKIYIIFFGKKLKKSVGGSIIKLSQNRVVCPRRKKNGNKDESKQKT